MNEKVKLIKQEKIDVKAKKGDKASINVRWTDNNQIMMTIVCEQDEVETLKKLFDFIAELDDSSILKEVE